MRRNILYHLHIFKNAGTTIDWILRKNFGSGWADHHGPYPESILTPESVEQFLIDHGDLVALSSHHIRFPLPKEDHFSLLPIVFVRHPIDRALSVYHFLKNQHGEFKRLGISEDAALEDYIRMRSHIGTEVGNWQTFFLSHDVNLSADERTVTREDLALAKRRIASASIIGVVDEFEISIVVAEDILRQYFCIDMAYAAQNVRPVRPSQISDRLLYVRRRLGSGLMRGLIDANLLDLELYDFTKEELRKRAEQVTDFESRLSEFNKRCLRFM